MISFHSAQFGGIVPILLFLMVQVAVCVACGEFLYRAAGGVGLWRRVPEAAFAIGYAVCSLVGFVVVVLTGSAKSILPAVLLLLIPLFLLGRRRTPTIQAPAFLDRYVAFRRSLPGMAAVAIAFTFCLLVGAYRLPGVVHARFGDRVVIGTNIYPDDMERNIGIPLSLAAHGYPLRSPIATEAVDAYPLGGFTLSAGMIAWFPRLPLQAVVADSMAQTALYGIAALIAAGALVCGWAALLTVCSALISVSYNLWNIHPPHDSGWFLKLWGYYRYNGLYTTTAWTPFAAMVWITNHVLAFGAIVLACVWFVEQRDRARHPAVILPTLALGVFGFSSSLDISVMSGIALGAILALSFLVARLRKRPIDWWLPATGIFVTSCTAFALTNLPSLLGRTDLPFFNPFEWVTAYWFNVGVLGSTLGPYLLLLALALVLAGFRLKIAWPWWIPLIVGLTFCGMFEFNSIWLWRFSMACHLLLGILCGLAAKSILRFRGAYLALWAVFLLPGLHQTKLTWESTISGPATRSLEEAQALDWVHKNTPLDARVAELQEAERGLFADANFLRTGNNAGTKVLSPYHPLIGYVAFERRMAAVESGLSANDYIIVPAVAASKFVSILGDCGAVRDYHNSGAAVYRMTGACRTAIRGPDLTARVEKALNESAAAAEFAQAANDPAKAAIATLARYAVSHPEAMGPLRTRIEAEYWSHGQYREAARLLQPVADQNPKLGEAQYSLAFSLHVGNIDAKRAVAYYTRALEDGYPEFWVLYNRGAAYLTLKDTKRAYSDLARARVLNPNHEGVRSLLSRSEFASLKP